MVEGLEHHDPLGASDHVRIQFSFNFNSHDERERSPSLNYEKASFEEIRNDLNLNWEEVLENKSTQEAFDELQSRILESVNNHVPKRKTNSKKQRVKPPWMNNATYRKTRKKFHTWIRYLNTKSKEDWKKYKTARNAATHAARQARRTFERRIAREVKSNNKSFWRYVNSRRKTRVNVGDLKDEEGKLTTEDGKKAEVLNTQYVRTFTHEDCSNVPRFILKPLQSDLLKTIVVTEEMVLKQLELLRIDKSPGNDGIHPRVLKEAAHELAKPLTIIFNSSIKSGKLPDQWREACVTPIYKKGCRTDPANYRPVSLTSIICKMLERFISDAILEHMRFNNLTCEQQHGFSKGKSTVTNLLEALDVWTEALSHGEPVDIIFLDYAKAFDTVPHERLINKVESFGIAENLLLWIRNFLTHRRQRVVVNGQASSWKAVTSGVPQGSVLGPLLFSMFVSDIPDELHNFVSLFADDTKIYAIAHGCESQARTHATQEEELHTSQTITHATQEIHTSNLHSTCLQADLNTLQRWSSRMQMKFHPDKCKVMHLGRRNPTHEYTMTKEDGTLHTLKVTHEEKDLGVTIDSDLKFSTHVQIQVNKANRVLGAIRHTFKYLDKEAFLPLYKSLVRPHLEYATVIWCPRTKRDRDSVERVQRRATKLVESVSHLSYPQRLQALQLPTLHFRRQRTDVIQLYKITHGYDKLRVGNSCSICRGTMFEPSLSTTTRGHSFKYQVQKSHGTRKCFFSSRVTRVWNSLSQEAVSSKSVNEFKNHIAHEWKNHQDMYNYTFTY
ncbi:hypothetical protein Bbelb_175010 [Branchiostoma belcheri]|nr:hypothetical protein Bbelb_175010 [Branchiostoma belcheri]